MIHFLKHHEIDLKKWDDCIKISPGGTVYAFSWYLNHVASGWDAIIEDDYESVFPLPRKRKFGVYYALQPLWSQQLGLFSRQVVTPGKSFEFLRVAMSRVSYLDMNLNSIQKLPSVHNFSVTENNNLQLPLIQSYTQIRPGYSENLKRNLKKAEGQLYLTENISHDLIIKMFKENRGKSISKLDNSAYKKLSALLYHSRSIGVAKVLGAADETNSLLCGAVFLIIKNKAVMIFSAINEHGRLKAAMPWLIDQFIQNHQQQNIILDFEGSNDPNLARFYSGFGATNVPYLRVRKNNLPLPDRCIEMFRKK